MPMKDPRDFDLAMDRLQAQLPRRMAVVVRYLRQPQSRIVRIPAAAFLVLGGVFSFLPVLGLWMLPLGLVLVAVDLPALRPPLTRMLHWIERKWFARREPS
ncbi:MAG: hypothetical protein F9K38_15665 [Pseudorhodoplanes sp.]|nr:MAG: hypothetical protein F9K38_15665 [Pseudorhodoplanes sp.]